MTNVDSEHPVLFTVHAILQRAMGSRYLLFALTIHLAVLAFLGPMVVVKPQWSTTVFKTKFLHDPATPAPPSVLPPPIAPTTPNKPTEGETRGASGIPSGPTGPPRLPGEFDRDLPSIITTRGLGREAPFSKGPSGGFGEIRPGEIAAQLDRDRYEGVFGLVGGIVDRTSRGPIPKATFTCYLGKYTDGDWNCNPTALENMLTQVGRWSKGRIQASVQPQALDLASDEIYKIKPPFIFLTGHRDFHFTEQEVENLREYLMMGGAIWADNSMPGRRSRFDEAFRREMKRVFPDRDFEPVSKDHDVFNAFFHFKEVPKGMNDYQEPLEQVRIGDELAVIYTQNAYSDLWETALNEENKIDVDLYLDEDTGNLYHKWGPHWGNSLTGFLYRNVNEESIVDANRLALNVIIHLLTRYDDKFRMLGKL